MATTTPLRRLKSAVREEQRNAPDTQGAVREAASNELFFGFVGAAGAGCSRAADSLKKLLLQERANGEFFKCECIKASTLIENWAKKNDIPVPGGNKKTLERVIDYQNLGDRLRKSAGVASVALEAIAEIRRLRAQFMDVLIENRAPIIPDQRPRAYIIDSLKNPAEVRLLREVYGDAFILVGVVCEQSVREQRLLDTFFTPRQQVEERESALRSVRDLMKRDAGDDQEDHGQHVTDTFHEADYFVDNSEDDPKNVKTYLNEAFGRLAEVLVHSTIRRPTTEETAMHMAYSAQLRSHCLSRQVGACLIDENGNILSTGTNEVPKAGGGVYGESHDYEDHRCYFQSPRSCSNNYVQNEIIEEVIEATTGLTKGKNEDEVKGLVIKLRKTSLGGLLEFSRAVHAEMDAILSAARAGASLLGARLFVTTFPCHYCARHIVTAGISEVQYIEPYPKSRALPLHKDSITTEENGWSSPNQFMEKKRYQLYLKETLGAAPKEDEAVKKNGGKVLFQPFVGIAPRLYQRVFVKDRPYKDKITGEHKIGEPSGSSSWQIPRMSYADLEAKLVTSTAPSKSRDPNGSNA